MVFSRAHGTLTLGATPSGSFYLHLHMLFHLSFLFYQVDAVDDAYELYLFYYFVGAPIYAKDFIFTVLFTSSTLNLYSTFMRLL